LLFIVILRPGLAGESGNRRGDGLEIVFWICRTRPAGMGGFCRFRNDRERCCILFRRKATELSG